jgi:hypothetical protein
MNDAFQSVHVVRMLHLIVHTITNYAFTRVRRTRVKEVVTE